MNFTFGIVTTDPSSDNMVQLLYSIEQQNIPDDQYDVIVVGGSTPYKDNLLTIIPFDEKVKSGWITRKKNIITETSRRDNIVYLHDYVTLRIGWYEGFKQFGNNFDACMTPILNADGTRYRDWTLWPDDITHLLGTWDSQYLLPYEVTNLSKYMYFSGAYWVAKRSLMERFPLDEGLSWGQSEDVLWSKQVREQHRFSLNTHSTVQLIKQKERVFNHASPERVKLLQDYANLQSK